MEYLAMPPTADEIERKLKRAINTAPGKDGIEYRHLRALDQKGRLLEFIFDRVWTLGIPASWKVSRTVPIYKKGDQSQYENFRPISLLPTMYKIFSRILAARLMDSATTHQWLSPEQKGFLPMVRGVQEHTFLLQAVIDEAKRTKRDISIPWLDLTNAFGSLPHSALQQLFESLPIPENLRGILSDIYSHNTLEFSVGSETVEIRSTAGVRQGDPLSSIIFNIAEEPVIRSAKTQRNDGFDAFGASVRTTADDIAVVGSCPSRQQMLLTDVESAAGGLGLSFNPRKCVSLVLRGGRMDPAGVLELAGRRVRALTDAEHE